MEPYTGRYSATNTANPKAVKVFWLEHFPTALLFEVTNLFNIGSRQDTAWFHSWGMAGHAPDCELFYPTGSADNIYAYGPPRFFRFNLDLKWQKELSVIIPAVSPIPSV